MSLLMKPVLRRQRSLAMSLVGLGAACLISGVLLCAAFTSRASAAFGILPGSYSSTATTLQAGDHPDLRISFAFNLAGTGLDELPDENVKTVEVKLPAGLVGNPQAVPRCSSDFLTVHAYCPQDTQVGVITYTLGGVPLQPPSHGITDPVYNMIPAGDHPAELAFENLTPGQIRVPILTSVTPQTNYRVTATVPQISANLKLFDSSITLWGVPADRSHDAERGSFVNGGCLGLHGPVGRSCPSGLEALPFTSNPTRCGQSATTDLTLESWQHPGLFIPTLLSEPQQMEGCSNLRFEPSLTVQPETRTAGVPSGYTVALHVPQTDAPTDLATPDLKSAIVTLPGGVRVSPSAADGLAACSDAQLGVESDTKATCPEASKIGTVKVITPLLPDPLEGAVFQGTQTPAHLLRLFLVVKGPGVLLKVAGSVDLNPSTGQITATFDNNPQLPFEDLILTFKGGPRAPLANPTACGTYTTTSDLTPWSTPYTPDATPSSSFQIDENCGARGFSPSALAGTTKNQAGAFSPFTVTIARTDADQELSGIQVKTPPGLLGKLSSVPLCGEADANAGTCPAASQIGHTTVGSGAGSNPVFLPVAGQPQNPVYLTAGYRGAPFGLSVVVPAIAGPFNLGTVVVRAAITVDPHTSQVTITSDPLPRILQGIVLQVKTVNVTVDRPGFMFNPTNCEPLSVEGTVSSTEGQSTNVSNRFQAVECGRLAFHPRFVATTQGNGKLNHNGASLKVKIAMHSGPGVKGEEANIRKVEVRLPKALPSRLTTLQKACTAAQFASNPAGCPPESFVGTAVAKTPVLSVPLSGPAYLVSHGGAGFPDLVLVLQGEGVRVDVVGHTDIKGGLTYSRFETVPDAPISSFALNLPEGQFSALAASTKLCGKKLQMPTTITGQNGAVLKQTTKVTVSGCPKAHKAHKSTRGTRG